MPGVDAERIDAAGEAYACCELRMLPSLWPARDHHLVTEGRLGCIRWCEGVTGLRAGSGRPPAVLTFLRAREIVPRTAASSPTRPDSR